jgi:tetratricopeptide (TPR) repeat protein
VRDSLLASGWLQHHSGSFDEARETQRRFTERYPDDPEGWLLRGDNLYHAPGWPPVPRQEALQDFRRAIALDPGFGPPYEHLINEAFARDDTAEARQLLAGLRQIDSTSQEAAGNAVAYALIFGDAAARAAAVAALDTAQTELLLGTVGAQTNYWTTCCSSSPGHWEQDLLVARALARPGRPPDVRERAQRAIGNIYTSRGRLREAREAFAEIPGPLAVDVARHILEGKLAADADPELIRRAVEVIAPEPGTYEQFLIGALAVRDGRWADVESQIEVIASQAGKAESRPDSLWFEDWALALRGYWASERGDRKAAIRYLEEAWPYADEWVLRLELAKSLLGEGDFRHAALYLENSEFQVRPFTTPIELYLGQLYEGLGNIPEARLHYGRFVSWWKDCDPELRPMWEQGRAVLVWLAGPIKL